MLKSDKIYSEHLLWTTVSGYELLNVDRVSITTTITYSFSNKKNSMKITVKFFWHNNTVFMPVIDTDLLGDPPHLCSKTTGDSNEALNSKHSGEWTNDELLDVSINALMTWISLHFQLLHLKL